MKDSASTSTPSLGGLAGSSQAGEKSLPGQQQQQPEEAGPPSLPPSLAPSQSGPLPEAPVFAPRPQARLLSETVATGGKSTSHKHIHPLVHSFIFICSFARSTMAAS